MSTRWLVVGGGAAGCVVAARLSEDAGNEVVVIEAGVDHAPGQVPDRGGPYLDDPGRLVPDVMVVRRSGGQPEPYALGLGLGGSSLVNGTLATPDPSLIVEHQIPLEQAQRLGTLGSAVLEADSRARPALLTRRDGQRVSAADAYLRPALHRSNLFVVAGSPVVELAFEGWKVVRATTADGVDYAADRVVLCAGAIGTPTLLLRSGIDTPGIGQGLQDHPACTINLELRPGSDVDAPMITVLLDRVTAQILPLNNIPGAPGYGALLAGLMSVTSTGRVSLPDRSGPPLIELNELSTAADRSALAEIVIEAAHLLRKDEMQRAVRRAALLDGTPLDAISDDVDEVAALVARQSAAGLYHLTSTCREGVVTDPFGGVLGYEGLFICDASLFPKAPPRNPYLPVIQLAEHLTAQWRSARP